MKKKIALLMACVMAFGVAVGGTLAWLTDSTQEVKNTFTDSDINITLTETTGSEYQMIPGHTITKEPVVTVKADSEACWLFVQVTENLGHWSDNKVKDGDTERDPVFKDYLNYSLDGWTALDNQTGVYYKKITTKTTVDTPYNVLTDKKVTVGENVTKAMMDEIDGKAADGTALEGAALKAETDGRPTLTFKAYAVQLYKDNKETPTEFGAAEAWAARPTT